RGRSPVRGRRTEAFMSRSPASTRWLAALGGAALTLVAGLVVPAVTGAGPSGAAPAPAACPPGLPATPAGWTLTFSDDFSSCTAGSPISTANWLFDTGTSYPGGAANWGTGE